MTRKWQVYLPEEIRKKAKLQRPTKVKIEVRKGKIILTPTRSPVLSLAGMLKGRRPKRKINLTKIRNFIDYSHI